VTLALDQVAAVVHRESGIRLAEHQHPFLQAALDRMGAGAEPMKFLRRASDPRQRATLVTRLIEEVTIQETSFLRDRAQLASIDWRLLLETARARGADHVRIWTSACATGEEAYSLAMLACEAFGPAPPPVRILATDISPDALDRARLGAYRSRSVRDLDPALRERYFRPEADGLVVGDRLRALVAFARHNLVHDPFPPLGHAPFDLILCRNVLIYFDGPTVGRVLDSLQRALALPGVLLLGAADALCASASRLARAPTPGPAPEQASPRTRGRLRRPLGRLPAEDRVDALLVEAAGPRGFEAVIAETSALIAADPLDAAAYFRRGLAELEGGDPAAAVGSLRRALYVEPQFGLAAFKLAGAHEALGDARAARRGYEQALRALEPDDRHEPFLAQIDLADVATAAQARLDVLGAHTTARVTGEGRTGSSKTS
jgi:chemotaxis methyl-accepting protein methylase